MIRATVRKYGHGIDTDIIIPARYLTSRDPAFLGSKCMEPVDREFPSRIQRGDVLVAGRNFGCGSSREHAVLALQGAGISCVVAHSYARIFYRNAINQGFPIVACPEAAEVAGEGDPIVIDLAAGEVTVSDRTFRAQPFPDFLRQIIAAGGLVPFVRQRIQSSNEMV